MIEIIMPDEREPDAKAVRWTFEFWMSHASGWRLCGVEDIERPSKRHKWRRTPGQPLLNPWDHRMSQERDSSAIDVPEDVLERLRTVVLEQVEDTLHNRRRG